MLRIIVISLFLVNLLLLGFQSSKPTVETKPTVLSSTAASRSVAEDSNVPILHLLSELMQNEDLMTGNRRCFSLGPFYSIEDRDEIRTRLLAVSDSISERQTHAMIEKGYWVYLPPLASLLEANQVLFSLQALGLKDIGIIYDDEWKNAISLGYFLRLENAQRRKKGLEDRGYTPLMRVRREAEPRFWLEYEQKPGSEFIALDMNNRPVDFMQRTLPCQEQEMITISGAHSPFS